MSKNPYPAQSGTNNSDNATAKLSAENSDAGYFEKSPMPQEEFQAKAAAQMT